MNASAQPIRTVPGKSISIKINQPVVAGQIPSTTATILASFRSVEHLLSAKPLRRPNRSHPLA